MSSVPIEFQPIQVLHDVEVSEPYQQWPTRIGPTLSLTSDLAKKIERFQSDCSVPGTFYSLSHAGLGSDLHVFSQMVALGMVSGRRFFTDSNKNPKWTWTQLSTADCKTEQGLGCYFHTKMCTEDTGFPMIEEDGQPEILNVAALSNETFRSTSCTKWYKTKALDCTKQKHSNCQPHVDTVSNEDVIGYLACIGNRNEWRLPFRAAFIEYLFSTGLTDIVKNEAIRQIKDVFGSSTVPKNIITVHLRWGNKGLEAPLLGIEAYRKGIESLVNKKNAGERINIYLATEDPRGLPALKAELEKTSAEDTESIWFKNGFKIYSRFYITWPVLKPVF